MRGKEELLYDVINQLEEESRELGIPSISREDGTLLAGLAFASCLDGDGLIVDAGAGMGYSTAWLILGTMGARGRCKVVAIEYDSRLFKYLQRASQALSKFANIEIINDNALSALSRLQGIRVLFVDVEKHHYPEALRLGAPRVKSGGVLAFHNAFFPRPPDEFFDAVKELGWPHIAVPTLAGGMLIIRKP